MVAAVGSDAETQHLPLGVSPPERLEIQPGSRWLRRIPIQGSERISWECRMAAGDDIVFSSRLSCSGLQCGNDRAYEITERERFSNFTGFLDLSKEHKHLLTHMGTVTTSAAVKAAAQQLPPSSSPASGSRSATTAAGGVSSSSSSSSSSNLSSQLQPVLVLELDNTYSWFTPKVVQLQLTKAYPSAAAALQRPRSFTAALSACDVRTRWEYALQLLGKMREAQVTPEAEMFNAAMKACRDTHHWQATLQLLDEMRSLSVRPEAQSYDIAIDACERGGQAEHALSLMDQLDTAVARGHIGGDRMTRSDDVVFLKSALREAVSRCPSDAEKLLEHLLAAQACLEQYLQTVAEA